MIIVGCFKGSEIISYNGPITINSTDAAFSLLEASKQFLEKKSHKAGLY